MIGLPENVSIYLCTEPVDFRKGFDGLTGIVTSTLGHSVTDGSLFLFVNRKRERRVDGEGQLFLDLGEEATPEVISALEEAVREAEDIVDAAEQEKQARKAKRPRKNDRKFPYHMPRVERIIDLPEDQREGLKLIGYDEVETLEWIRPELRVRVNKYAKYAHPTNKAAGIASPPRPTGLVEGDRFDASIGVEVVAWKYFYHLPFYRQQDLFAGCGWTPSRSTLANRCSHHQSSPRAILGWRRRTCVVTGWR